MCVYTRICKIECADMKSIRERDHFSNSRRHITYPQVVMVIAYVLFVSFI